MTAAPRAKRAGPTTLAGSAPAKRIAVVLLEVLSGVCGPAEGSRRLGLSLTRVLCARNAGAAGLAPGARAAPTGPDREGEAEAARRDHQRLEREVLRLQALVRATQRAVALAPPPKDTRRRRKTAPRAGKVIAQLRVPAPDGTGPSPN